MAMNGSVNDFTQKFVSLKIGVGLSAVKIV